MTNEVRNESKAAEANPRMKERVSACRIIDFGISGYRQCYLFQKELHRLRREKKVPDTLLVGEHFPVITAGRSAKPEHFIADAASLSRRQVEVFRVDRGGSVSVHMPGQAVMYPVFDLSGWKKDIHAYVYCLEEVLLRVLCRCGVRGRRSPGRHGVWAGEQKIGFIGVGISKWIGFHGISMNVDCDLGLFSLIHPCGITGCPVTCLRDAGAEQVSVSQTKESLAQAFQEVFFSEYAPA